MKNKAIGIFDSGIGGLTLLKEIEILLPNENLIYLGDTARVPYGTKSKSTIERFSLEDVQFLLEFDVKLIVAACNTVSALALPYLSTQIHPMLVNVIDPAVNAALQATQNGRIGVIGTQGTIKSRAYLRSLEENPHYRPGIEVQSIACPLFVPLVEEDWIDEPETRLIAQKYLQPLISAKIDTLILGCTHYPLLKEVIREIMGPRITLIDSAQSTAQVISSILHREKLLSTASSSTTQFFVTDDPEKFKRMGERFLNRAIAHVNLAIFPLQEKVSHDC